MLKINQLTVTRKSYSAAYTLVDRIEIFTI